MPLEEKADWAAAQKRHSLPQSGHTIKLALTVIIIAAACLTTWVSGMGYA